MISDNTFADSASFSAAVSALKGLPNSNNAAVAAVIAIRLGTLAHESIHSDNFLPIDLLEMTASLFMKRVKAGEGIAAMRVAPVCDWIDC
jgi:hypothetical protein